MCCDGSCGSVCCQLLFSLSEEFQSCCLNCKSMHHFCGLTPHAPTPSSVRAALCARDNIAHVMLAALAALNGTRAGELYGRLRANYNAHRPPRSPPAPPLEEWRGLSMFCEDFHCRWVTVGCPSSNGLSIEGFDAGTVHHAYGSPTDPKLW